MRRPVVYPATAVCALALAAGAAGAAYVCHPDPAGTRSLTLAGTVVAYSFEANTVTVALDADGACTALVWRVAAGTVAPSRASCRGVSAARPPARPATARVVPGGFDRPDRLAVGARGRVVRSWPLPVRAQPHTLQVSGGLATFLARGVARGSGGLWVARLRDGRTSFVAPVAANDRPLLGATGVVYQDNVYRRARADRPVLKFVPTRALHRELWATGRALQTGGPIRSFSVDGARVALAVGGGDARCDRIVFWNISWRSVGQVSQKLGPTCPSVRASSRISAVALGGARAQWVTVHDGRPMIVAADAIDCQEWVIRRLSDFRGDISLAGIAADGPTLAYALVGRTQRATSSEVGRVTRGYRGQDVFRLGTAVRAVSAARGRIAVLGRNGSIQVRTEAGALVRMLSSPGATSLALGGDLLVTTAGDRLRVYAVSSGRLIHSWRLPRGAGRVDLQYGLAVVTAGRSVYAVDVERGRVVRVAVARAAVRAQIEPIGIVYAYSTAGRGTARLVPMSRVESALR